MSSEFLRGYLQIAEGEKDPRNLMLAFSIARIILIEFDISSCVDVCSFVVSYTLFYLKHARTSSTSPFAISQSVFDLRRMTLTE